MIDLDMGIQLFHRVFDSAVAVCHAWVVVPFSGEITKEVSREIQECEAMKKTLVWLGYIGDYTTQLYRDYNKRL